MSNDPLLELIPIGEQNAASVKMVWEAQGRMWTVAAIKGRLNSMVKAGKIERKYVPCKIDSSSMGVYFRKTAT